MAINIASSANYPSSYAQVRKFHILAVGLNCRL